MIISHQHRFIFFAVPKTGTHAIRFALRPHLAQTDEEQVGLYIRKSLADEDLSKLKHGHISCLQAKAALAPEIWDNYFKFGFVRNPWDRFVSYCFYMNRQNRKFAKSPLPRMKEILQNAKVRERILFRPQHEIVCDSEYGVLLDFIGKFEHLKESYERICQQIDLPIEVLEHLNATIRQDYSIYYDDELKQQVADFYQKDIQIFDYQF